MSRPPVRDVPDLASTCRFPDVCGMLALLAEAADIAEASAASDGLAGRYLEDFARRCRESLGRGEGEG